MKKLGPIFPYNTILVISITTSDATHNLPKACFLFLLIYFKCLMGKLQFLPLNYHSILKYTNKLSPVVTHTQNYASCYDSISQPAGVVMSERFLSHVIGT